MPIEHTIDVDRRLVRSRLWGIVTEIDAWGSAAALMDDPAFDRTFVQLADMREVTHFQVSQATIRQLATTRIFAPGVRRALVVASGLQSAVGQMTTSYAEGGEQEFVLFVSVAEAERWLGIAGTSIEC